MRIRQSGGKQVLLFSVRFTSLAGWVFLVLFNGKEIFDPFFLSLITVPLRWAAFFPFFSGNRLIPEIKTLTFLSAGFSPLNFFCLAFLLGGFVLMKGDDRNLSFRKIGARGALLAAGTFGYALAVGLARLLLGLAVWRLTLAAPEATEFIFTSTFFQSLLVFLAGLCFYCLMIFSIRNGIKNNPA